MAKWTWPRTSAATRWWPWLGGFVILAALLLGTGALITQLKALKSPPGSQPG